MALQQTTSQTVGPYLHIGLTWLITEEIAAPGAKGERITLTGRVLDGDGKPVNDALVEIWQADADGRYPSPEDPRGGAAAGFRGFGRSATDADGRFRFTTIKPGAVPGPGGESQAPHLNVTVFMRGLLKQLKTRMYFPGDAANANDFALAQVPADRRGTLVAKATAPGALEWNLILQGADETVFFEFA
jgi:protocatechuate 3,4-dioxygenase alpha subunit